MPQQDPEKQRADRQMHYAIHRDERIAYQQKYREENRMQIRAKDRIYYQEHLEEQHAKSSRFYINNKPRILTKMLAYVRHRRATNPELERSHERRRYAENPAKGIAKTQRRRARRCNAPINNFTAAEWATMKAHYGFTCVYCHRKMQRLTQDHIIPLIKGGSHTKSNIVPACRSCNSKKGTGSVLCPIQPMLL